MTGNNHTGSLAQQKSERRAPFSTGLALSTSAVALWAGEMLLLVELGPWQAEFLGKTTPAQGQKDGIVNPGQCFIGWTSLLWCAKAVKFWTVQQYEVQPRSDSLTGPVKYSALMIWFSEAKAGQVSLCARFIHSGQSQSDKEKSGFILVARVKHWHHSQGPWRTFQHNLTGLLLCLMPTQGHEAFQLCCSPAVAAGAVTPLQKGFCIPRKQQGSVRGHSAHSYTPGIKFGIF